MTENSNISRDLQNYLKWGNNFKLITSLAHAYNINILICKKDQTINSVQSVKKKSVYIFALSTVVVSHIRRCNF